MRPAQAWRWMRRASSSRPVGERTRRTRPLPRSAGRIPVQRPRTASRWARAPERCPGSAAAGTSGWRPVPAWNAYRALTLVPARPGSTASIRPWTTASLMPSLTYGGRVGLAPEPLSIGLVAREQQLRVAVAGQAVPAQAVMGRLDDGPVRAPAGWVVADRRRSPTPIRCGTRASAARAACAASGPRFAAVIRMRMSSGATLAYSTNTSK